MVCRPNPPGTSITCHPPVCLSDKCGEFADVRHKQKENGPMVNSGDKAPEFKLPTNGDGEVTFPPSNPCVLFFYPKDDTPGCTTEATEFTAARAEFDKLGVQLFGLSPDTAQKHDKFIAKHGLDVTLISDPEQEALQAYGVWVEKKMYGRTYMGVERSTFLISADGEIVEAWRKVKVKGHVAAVLEAAQQHFAG